MSAEGFIQFKGRTGWERYGLDQIWAMVAHEDGTVTAAQVQSWRRTAELCEDQAHALESAVGQLFRRWPPRPGTAAAAFQDRMRDMIKSMHDSAAHAAGMPDPLWKITNQLTMTRYDILDLLQQRAATEKIERSQDPTHANNGKAGGRPEPGTLPTNWRDQFDHRAREIMATTEAVVAQAATHLKPPPRFIPSGQLDPGQPVNVAASTNGSHPAGGASSEWTGTMARPIGLTTPRQEVNPQLGSEEPVLAGLTPPTVSSAATADFSASSPGRGQVSAGPTLGTIFPPGLVADRLPRTNPQAPISSSATAGSSLTSGARGAANQGAMVPPMTGRPAPASSGGGGVRPSGRRRFRKDDDEPWGGRSGVPSVIEPLPEPARHDPGPGVIGIDR